MSLNDSIGAGAAIEFGATVTSTLSLRRTSSICRENFKYPYCNAAYELVISTRILIFETNSHYNPMIKFASSALDQIYFDD